MYNSCTFFGEERDYEAVFRGTKGLVPVTTRADKSSVLESHMLCFLDQFGFSIATPSIPVGEDR